MENLESIFLYHFCYNPYIDRKTYRPVLYMRRRFPAILSMTLTMFLLIFITIGLIGLIIPMITDQAKDLSLLNTPQLR
ncbi:MAG: hypothetical protein ABI045_04605 [Flavobacteriales bacterium]